MTSHIYKTTLKTTMRNPATLLSLIAVVLIWINATNAGVGQVGGFQTMLKLIYNWAAIPIQLMLPTFAAVVCSVGILHDKKNNFYDIEKATAMKTLSYYLAKLAAFATVCLALLFLFITTWITYSVFFGQARQNLWGIGLADFLIRMFRTTLVLSIPSIFVYIGIPTMMSLLTNSAVCGIASGIAFSLMGMIFGLFIRDSSNAFGNYIYPISNTLTQFMYYYDSEYAFPNVGFTDALLTYALTIPVSLVLLTIGYVALRGKED